MCSGLMDEVKIFSNALSSEEIKEIYSDTEIPKINFEVDKGTEATIRINEILSTLDIPKEDGEGDEE